MLISNIVQSVYQWMQPKKASIQSSSKTFSSEVLSKTRDSNQNDPVAVYQDLCAE